MTSKAANLCYARKMTKKIVTGDSILNKLARKTRLTMITITD